jgi:hypothetical protein
MDGFLLEVPLENVLTMSESKVLLSPDDVRKEHLPAVAESGRDQLLLQSAFTLRVKPDRRRVQLPIPPGLDRRRTR